MRICARVTCITGTPAERVASAKRDVLQASLATEVDALARLARDGLDEAMRAADLTETALRRGVVALLVHCPVYRSYATADQYSAGDEAIWDEIAAAVARSRRSAHRGRSRAPAGAV